jgi:hypothetical protein
MGKEITKKIGIFEVIRPRAQKITARMNHLIHDYNVKFKTPGIFRFQGRTYQYFWNDYNTTSINERAVEVALIWEEVKKHHHNKILEVGNVLSHYFSTGFDVLDKYDYRNGVINQDVVDYKPSKKYDLIVSISTLEHVGWDERPRDNLKIPRAVENLTKCLSQKGKIISTMPLGHNPVMDRLLREDKIPFTGQYYLKRISRDNKWMEIGKEDAVDIRFGYPFHCANGLAIGIVEK